MKKKSNFYPIKRDKTTQMSLQKNAKSKCKNVWKRRAINYFMFRHLNWQIRSYVHQWLKVKKEVVFFFYVCIFLSLRFYRCYSSQDFKKFVEQEILILISIYSHENLLLGKKFLTITRKMLKSQLDFFLSTLGKYRLFVFTW